MDSNNPAGSSVQPQVDLGHVSFTTFDALRRLMFIASQRNVQPEAVLAVEALGFNILASPKRISEAIEALGGSKSIRIERLKTAIGYRADELHMIFRKSTPLLQFFLLYSACKPCYTDSEMGDIFHGMLDQLGILSKHPVSSAQLGQLLGAFTSHAEILAPVKEMHGIASAVDERNPSLSGLYDHIDKETLSELLTKVFQYYRDDKVAELVLTGSIQGVWLATVLSWLLPEDVLVTLEGERLLGSLNTRLKINLSQSIGNRWDLDIWRNDDNLTKYIKAYKTPRTESDYSYIGRFPIRLTKSHLAQRYLSVLERETRTKAIQLVGEISSALVRIAVEEGTVYRRKVCCEDRRKKCTAVPFSRILSDDQLARYHLSISNYGWNSIRQNEVDKIHEKLRQELRNGTASESSLTVAGFITRACRPFLIDMIEELTEQNTLAGDPGDDISSVIDPAILVASDIVTTLRTDISPECTRYMSLETIIGFQRTDSLIDSILSGDLEIQELQRLSFHHLLPGIDAVSQDLIIARDGYVAFMNVLQNSTTSQKDVFRIVYARGSIDKNGIGYASVREADPTYDVGSDFFDTDPRELDVDMQFAIESTISKNEQTIRSSLPNRSQKMKVNMNPRNISTTRQTSHNNHGSPVASYQQRPDDDEASFVYRTSVQGNNLIVKPYYQYSTLKRFNIKDTETDGSPDHYKLRRVSWISSVMVIATAESLNYDEDLTAAQQKLIMNRFKQRGDVIYVVPPFYEWEWKTEHNFRAVIRSPNDSVLFFTSGTCFDILVETDRCLRIFINKNSLMPTLRVVQKTSDSWLLFC